MKKNKLTTILIVIATIVLAGIAVFTALRIYQLRTRPVAPTVPESSPAAATAYPTATPEACKALTFKIPTPAPKGCNSTCQTDADCASSSFSDTSGQNLICYTVTCPPGENCIDLETKVCREKDCPDEPDCFCGYLGTPTPTATSTAKATATPTATATATGSATSTPTPTPTGSATSIATSTGSPIAYTTATPSGELPEAGTSMPTILGLGAGFILLIVSIALAL